MICVWEDCCVCFVFWCYDWFIDFLRSSSHSEQELRREKQGKNKSCKEGCNIKLRIINVKSKLNLELWMENKVRIRIVKRKARWCLKLWIENHGENTNYQGKGKVKMKCCKEKCTRIFIVNKHYEPICKLSKQERFFSFKLCFEGQAFRETKFWRKVEIKICTDISF